MYKNAFFYIKKQHHILGTFHNNVSVVNSELEVKEDSEENF